MASVIIQAGADWPKAMKTGNHAKNISEVIAIRKWLEKNISKPAACVLAAWVGGARSEQDSSSWGFFEKQNSSAEAACDSEGYPLWGYHNVKGPHRLYVWNALKLLKSRDVEAWKVIKGKGEDKALLVKSQLVKQQVEDIKEVQDEIVETVDEIVETVADALPAVGIGLGVVALVAIGVVAFVYLPKGAG